MVAPIARQRPITTNMSRKLYFQDDSIELIEVASSVSSVENIRSNNLLAKLKKKNRIHSPANASPASYSSSSHISEAFAAKQIRPENQDTPSRQSIFSIKSETYKDKLRNRFLSVKNQAAIQKNTRKKNSTKSPLKINNSVLESELDRHENIKSKWRKPNGDVAYDFFCSEIQEESTPVEKDELHSEQSLIDLLNIDVNDGLLEYLPIEIVDLSLYEKDVYWSPFRKSVIIEKPHTDLIDDGIYEDKICDIPKRELSILEKRLYNDNSNHWFNEDGQLKLLPDPRLQKSYKPFKTGTSHRDFITDYIPPTTHQFEDTKILDFILYQINFAHHPLFSLEHVLVQRLKSHYDIFVKRKRQNLFVTLNKKVEALQCARRLLENNANDEISESRLQKYATEIQEARLNMYREGRIDRELIKVILYVWKSIKKLRSVQKYSSTSAKLIITKEDGDYDRDLERWQNNIADEVSETVKLLEEEYVAEMEKYRDRIREWKRNKVSDKPVMPKRTFDVDEIRAAVTKRCVNSLRSPGEPHLDFDLDESNDVTSDVDSPSEKLRRNAVNKTQLFIRILYNKQEVCKSKMLPLNDAFTCTFNKFISIQFRQVPNRLTLQIYEQTTPINRQLLAEMSINTPDVHCDLSTASKCEETFVKESTTRFSHAGVGSGVNLRNLVSKYEIQCDEDVTLYSRGNLEYACGWNLENQSGVDAVNKLEVRVNTNTTNLDPQDPNNAFLLDVIQNSEAREESDYFRLNPDIEEFCTAEEMNANPRFKLLTLRDKNEPEFQGVIVPNRPKEIADNVFQAYEKRLKDDKISEMIDKIDADDIDEHRERGRRYFQNIENRIIQMTKAAEKRISLKDVLIEEPVPTIGTLGLTFMNWLQPNRPLRPVRKSPKQPPITVAKTQTKIIVNIIGATQIPIRKDPDTNQTTEPLNIVPLRPFVSVTFRDVRLKTTVAEGPNPTWNQELTFTIPLQNKEPLYIQIFDEVMVDLIDDDRLRPNNIHKRLRYNYLGGLELPFSTLVYNNRIEGTFKINSPPLLMGYEHTMANVTGISHKNDTYLSIFLTLEPFIGQPHSSKCCLECNELPYISDHVSEWQTQYNLSFPQRTFASMVANVNGEMCCVTRYLRPIKPPILTADISETTTEQCAKYVAMIPFRDQPLLRGVPQVWLSPEQLLTLMNGSVQDHAVLLACYLMYCGLNCWIVLGYGIPRGNTTFLLVKRDRKYFIIDVETAQKYNVNDIACPLQRVYCLISDDNVWGNVQNEDRLHLMRFDLTKHSDWRALFGRGVNAPIAISHQSIPYLRTPPVSALQERIEGKLKKKFMKWRKHTRTVWNHYCSSTLKQILPRMEKSHMENDGFVYQEYLSELQMFLNAYNVYGFAVSFPYLNCSKIVEFLHHTGVHCDEGSDVEFALAIFVQDYPNYVLKVWLAVLSLTRR